MSIDKDRECIICLDVINNKQDINFFKDCEHCINYHNDCVNGWINECIDKNIIPSCPICRKELELINISDSFPESRQIINISDSLPESEQIINIYNDQLRNDISTIYSLFYYTQRFCCICTVTTFCSIIIVGFFNKKFD